MQRLGRPILPSRNHPWALGKILVFGVVVPTGLGKFLVGLSTYLPRQFEHQTEVNQCLLGD